jgi:hypothetical protein
LSRWSLTAFALAVLAGSTLTACQSTQDKARELHEQGEALAASQVPLTIPRPSKDVKVLDTTLLSDENGDAIVVELQNTSKQTLVNVPILVDVRDAKGKSIFRNDTFGLEPSLQHVPLLKPGETVDWVNDQLYPTGAPKSAKVTVGISEEQPPPQLPQLEVSEPTLHDNPLGVEIEGKVTNKSQLDQKKLVLFAVARSGGRVVAAGRGQIKNLKVRARPGSYNIFFIGDPRGAEITVEAPPTVFQ